MTFDKLGLRNELLQAITEMNFKVPTPIQERAIPEVLSGKDLMCCAQTGTGKTAAFGLPMLHRLAAGPRAQLRALIVVPTRELAIQVARHITDYAKHLDLVVATIYGGVPIRPQEMVLRHGADIVVATPGRLKDHTWQGNIDFRNTEFLVLDEADRMLDMGFIKDIREIVELLPTERQTMLFSATLGKEIERLARDFLVSPVRIDVAPPASTLDTVEQLLVRTRPDEKRQTLERLIKSHGMERAIIFARTKAGASRLAGRLSKNGHNASAIHSDRSQNERVRALEGFRKGRVRFLVATDIAARGIDVDDISHVVNYDLPRSAEDYVHRIGRTARAGRKGTAISLITPEDDRGVRAIEKLISMRISCENEAGQPVVRDDVMMPPRKKVKPVRAAAPGRSRRSSKPGGQGRPNRRRRGGGQYSRRRDEQTRVQPSGRSNSSGTDSGSPKIIRSMVSKLKAGLHFGRS